MLNWFRQFQQVGGFFALSHQIGDYNLLYQTLIALMSQIPINPVYQFKALSVIFDYLLAFLAGYIVSKKEGSTRNFALSMPWCYCCLRW